MDSMSWHTVQRVIQINIRVVSQPKKSLSMQNDDGQLTNIL